MLLNKLMLILLEAMGCICYEERLCMTQAYSWIRNKRKARDFCDKHMKYLLTPEHYDLGGEILFG